MKAERVDADASQVNLNIDELAILSNALNEVCHGIKIPGFSIRLGATREEVKQLLRQINDVIGTMDDLSPNRERAKVTVHKRSDEANPARRKRIE